MTVDTRRIAGCDLGKSQAKFVVAERHADGTLTRLSNETVAHHGNPIAAFSEWYSRQRIDRCHALGATGLYAVDLIAPVVRLPEEACLEAALAQRPELQGPLNVVNISARGYSVLSRDASGQIRTLGNEKCSSGTGETMVKIAGRFGLSIGEADALALSADAEVPITARCSVFAKSEMTHFGNQGRPADQLFRGYFGSIARYALALLARVRVEGPIYVVGGASRLQSLIALLNASSDLPVRVPDEALMFEAIGALALVAGQTQSAGAPLPEDPSQLVAHQQARFERLPAPREFADHVTRLSAPTDVGPADQPTVLGLDLGSTGSKAALTAIADGTLVWDAYDQTRGNPVEATSRLVATLLEGVTPDIRAIAVTGSGREAAATVLRACFPELVGRIVVQNEIVAHGTAAIHCDPDGGRSLSVVEIGGQDAKFIQIVDGQIVESDMNKACSAGTGSFLEEQSLFYGVDQIETFTELARQAGGPPNLGQMCTVFVAEAAAESQSEGFELADIFGGFQYSVVYNYINRVMGSRKFGERIFFQGKPATGPSLAWTLAAVTGRCVFVPPNPGAMGAWGIGLCALADCGAEVLSAQPAFDLSLVLLAKIVGRSDFRCNDTRCGTLCNIDRTTVQVGGRERKVLSGGACPKFEIAGTGKRKLPREAPSAFDERESLLEPFTRDSAGDRVIGVPMLGAAFAFTPWITTFLRSLGFGVRVLRSDGQSLSRGEERCYSYDACAPLKVAHAVCDADLETIFFPKILDICDCAGPGGKTCPLEQAGPEVVAHALHARKRTLTMLHPQLRFRDGYQSWQVLAALFPLAALLRVSRDQIITAVARAAEAQQAFEQALQEIGRRSMQYAEQHKIPLIAVIGPLHVINDRSVNAGIPAMLRQSGVLALPMDTYPLTRGLPDLPAVVWGDANRALRVAIATRETGFAFPLMLSTFGCGPASFVEHLFNAVTAGYPHTILESDGHGGAAGYLTRIQAFLHTIERYDGRPSPVTAERLEFLAGRPDPSILQEQDSRLIFFAVGDRIPALYAAFYRSLGFDAVGAGPTGPQALAYGRQDCSGKECLAYQLIWGSFRQKLEEAPSLKRSVLVEVQGEGMCRNCMFSLKDRLAIEEHGLQDRVDVRHARPEPEFGLKFLTRHWAATVVWDLLHQFRAYCRPLERAPGEVDGLYTAYCDRLEALVEQRDPGGLSGLLQQPRLFWKLRRLVRDASQAFASLLRHGDAPDRRTVLLAGDIYLRLDSFASDQLIRRLNARGIHVLVEPGCSFAEYLAEERSPELIGLPTGFVDNLVAQQLMGRLRTSLYRAARIDHPWLPQPDSIAMTERANRLLDRYPVGEAPITIRSVLQNWEDGSCDGVVLVGPWGCGPALISESILRHQQQIPLLVLYNDGSPIDERKLDGFVFRLSRTARRSPASTVQVVGQ